MEHLLGLIACGFLVCVFLVGRAIYYKGWEDGWKEGQTKCEKSNPDKGALTYDQAE
jgi:hypothetical protein